jgi:hypothetical protein
MIYAELKGKTFPEDILTSNVFGLLKLLPERILFSILSNAINLKRDNLEEIKSFDKIEKLEFWPSTSWGVPDLILILSNKQDDKAAVVIEVKYGASKTGTAYLDAKGDLKNKEEDQLARYWRYLCYEFPKFENKFLVYLTEDRTIPLEEIGYSIKATDNEARIYWLSWFKINNEVMELIKEDLPPVEKRILELIKVYLEHKGFICFDGWTRLHIYQGINDSLCKLSYNRTYKIPFYDPSRTKLSYLKIFKIPVNYESLPSLFYYNKGGQL